MGLTSQDVVTKIKWALINLGYAKRGIKIGHGGTLDPFATGVLAVLFGEATKLADCYLHSEKAYDGVIRLGQKTNTADLTGDIVSEKEIPELSNDEWTRLSHEFVNQAYFQTPPMFSAKKKDGKTLYDLARAGIEVDREPILKKISAFSVAVISKNELSFQVECESGTYVRVLAEDLAERVGTQAHLTQLRRTRSSDFRLERSLGLDQTLEALEQKNPLSQISNFSPLSEIATHIPSILVSSEVVSLLKQGQKRAVEPVLMQMKAAAPHSRYGIVRCNHSPVALLEHSENTDSFRLQRILN